MEHYEKPLPAIDNDTRYFWEQCKKEKLVIQQCETCNKYIFYPRSICPHCMSDQVKWVESTGKGTIYSYTVARRPGGPGFKDDVPYVIALIELNEGVRMMSTIIDCAISDLACDLPVEVVFDEVTEDVTLPKFKLVQ